MIFKLISLRPQNVCFGHAISLIYPLNSAEILKIQLDCDANFKRSPFELLPKKWQVQLNLREAPGSGYKHFNFDHITDYLTYEWPSNVRFIHVYINFENHSHIFTIHKAFNAYRVIDINNENMGFYPDKESLFEPLKQLIEFHQTQGSGTPTYFRAFWYERIS